jgi:succinoglycan biosynthesis protein ExoM
VSGLRVTVAVLTYRRPEHLATVLPLLVAQLDDVDGAQLLVVDNDAAGSAAAVVDPVRAAEGGRVRYVIEPRPGIPSARNRALAECGDRDLLAFIDDDEQPAPGWLAALVAAQERYGAAAVAGPVVSSFDRPPDPWVEAGGLFERRHLRHLRTGDHMAEAATNNLLLDLRVLRRLDLRFATDIGMSAGEDNILTRAVTDGGGTIVWCADALVTEVVPAHRATRRWVLERHLSSGNVLAMTTLRTVHGRRRRVAVRLRLGVGGAGRLVLGAVRWAFGAVAGSLVHQARGARSVSRGAGLMAGSVGWTYQAYRRPKRSSGEGT